MTYGALGKVGAPVGPANPERTTRTRQHNEITESSLGHPTSNTNPFAAAERPGIAAGPTVEPAAAAAAAVAVVVIVVVVVAAAAVVVVAAVAGDDVELGVVGERGRATVNRIQDDSR